MASTESTAESPRSATKFAAFKEKIRNKAPFRQTSDLAVDSPGSSWPTAEAKTDIVFVLPARDANVDLDLLLRRRVASGIGKANSNLRSKRLRPSTARRKSDTPGHDARDSWPQDLKKSEVVDSLRRDSSSRADVENSLTRSFATKVHF